MGTFDKARKGEVLLQSLPQRPATIEDILNCVPELIRNERLVSAFVELATPFECACIEPGSQDLVDSARRDRRTAPAVRKTLLPNKLADILQ